MDKLVIDGGHRLSGTVRTSGAKNAALPILISTLVAPGQHTIENVPELVDISTTLSLLGRLGCPSLVAEPGESGVRGPIVIDTSRIAFREAPYDLVRKMRASVLALGPLLARCGEARVSLPGGCAIGVRPIDQHLKGLEALGCRFELTGGYVYGRADRLQGAEVHLDFPTVTGTENILMAAVLADGVTHIHNAAREPEIVDLVKFLRSMGARIEGEGTEVLAIDGVPALRPARTPHSILPDRIEAGTYLIAALTTQGDVTVSHVDPATLEVLFPLFRAAGAEVTCGEDWVRVRCDQRPEAVSVETRPHPGFPTDMQAQWMAAMSLANGTSTMRENIFENRFMHVAELSRLGSDIAIRGNEATITGVDELVGATVMATDLRASASLVLAGLAARGQTQLLRLYHLDRGYAHLVEKLGGLGARVVRVADNVDVPVGSVPAPKGASPRVAG
jgi:UDP-N-acetylglucosamine 1-carboxyvinyltransferase